MSIKELINGYKNKDFSYEQNKDLFLKEIDEHRTEILSRWVLKSSSLCIRLMEGNAHEMYALTTEDSYPVKPTFDEILKMCRGSDNFHMYGCFVENKLLAVVASTSVEIFPFDVLGKKISKFTLLTGLYISERAEKFQKYPLVYSLFKKIEEDAKHSDEGFILFDNTYAKNYEIPHNIAGAFKLDIIGNSISFPDEYDFDLEDDENYNDFYDYEMFKYLTERKIENKETNTIHRDNLSYSFGDLTIEEERNSNITYSYESDDDLHLDLGDDFGKF